MYQTMTSHDFQETEARLLEVRLGQGLPGEVEVEDEANHEIDLGKTIMVQFTECVTDLDLNIDIYFQVNFDHFSIQYNF